MFDPRGWSAAFTACSPSHAFWPLDFRQRFIATFRVPAVYLSLAFLAILAVLSEQRMNNLRVFNGLDGSIPTRASKKSPVLMLVFER
jgi:hypothetical protein